MATKGADRLYELLPAVYREQDAENGFPLRGLTKLVGDQLDLLEVDIEQLWNDLFIETCRRWVIPYIGDLVSNNLLFDGGRGSMTADELFPDLAGPDLRPPVAIRTRADVAKTIYYRRRKGTLPMLEELARDVTGWPAHAVEFFELLGWTQHLEHFRPQACWFDIRSLERSDRVDGAFDEASHTVDVAPISTFDGWHTIKNIGFFLWRLVPNRLLVDARQSSTTPWRFYFSPLGNPAPLFTHPRREDEETRLSTELHVPEPIRRAFFGLDLSLHQGPPPTDFTSLYGLPSDPGLAAPPVLLDDASLFVIVDQTAVLPADVRCRRLDAWPATRPTGSVVWIDVENGRLALGTGFDETKPVRVFMTFGFPAMLGGGAYERRAWLAQRSVAVTEYDVRTGGTGAAVPDRRRRADAMAGRRAAERDDHDPRQPHLRAAGRHHAVEPATADHRGRERRATASADARGRGLRGRRGRRAASRSRAPRRADLVRVARRGLPARRRRRRAAAPAPLDDRPRSRPEGGRNRAQLGAGPHRRAGNGLGPPQRTTPHRDRVQRLRADRVSRPRRGHLAARLDRRRPGRRGDLGARERALGAAAHRARHAARHASRPSSSTRASRSSPASSTRHARRRAACASASCPAARARRAGTAASPTSASSSRSARRSRPTRP